MGAGQKSGSALRFSYRVVLPVLVAIGITVATVAGFVYWSTAKSDDRAHLTREAADLLFHTLVMLAAKDVALADVLAELERREGTSGLDEKKARAES